MVASSAFYFEGDTDGNGHHHNNDNNNPRLVLRNLPFYQSKNKYQMMNKSTGVNKNDVWKLRYYFDLFHVLIRQPTSISISTLLVTWTATILMFSGLYYAVDRVNPAISCGLGREGAPLTYRASFAFSLQTCTTVGYTLPSGSNAFFENCPELQIVIYFQMVLSMLFNGVFFAFLYTRIARSDNRGVQVMYSDKAIISIHDVISSHNSPTSYYNRNNKQQVRLQVRIYDVSSNSSPVVEAHVRLYAIMKKKKGDSNVAHDPTPIPLRILQPNDQFNSMLFLSIPSVVSHHIDLYSILHPPTSTTIPPPPQTTSSSTTSSSVSSSSSPSSSSRTTIRTLKHGLHLRQADSRTGSREEILCPICGESYGTVDRLYNHIRYSQVIEKHDGWDENNIASHLSINAEEYINMIPEPNRNIEEIRQYFIDNISEIIVLVEGIEPTVSGTFSALHSYCMDDIIFHPTALFQPCLLRHHYYKTYKTKLMVDLNRFHCIDYSSYNISNNKNNKDNNADLNDTTAAYDVISSIDSVHRQQHPYQRQSAQALQSAGLSSSSSSFERNHRQRQRQRQSSSISDGMMNTTTFGRTSSSSVAAAVKTTNSSSARTSSSSIDATSDVVPITADDEDTSKITNTATNNTTKASSTTSSNTSSPSSSQKKSNRMSDIGNASFRYADGVLDPIEE